MGIPSGPQESRSPLLELSIGDQQLGAPLAQVDTHSVAGLYECEAPVGGRLRRCIEYRRRAARSGLPPIADAGQRMDAFCNQVSGRAHIHDFRAARISDRAGSAHDEERLWVLFAARGRRYGGGNLPGRRKQPRALRTHSGRSGSDR